MKKASSSKPTRSIGFAAHLHKRAHHRIDFDVLIFICESHVVQSKAAAAREEPGQTCIVIKADQRRRKAAAAGFVQAAIGQDQLWTSRADIQPRVHEDQHIIERGGRQFGIGVSAAGHSAAHRRTHRLLRGIPSAASRHCCRADNPDCRFGRVTRPAGSGRQPCLRCHRWEALSTTTTRMPNSPRLAKTVSRQRRSNLEVFQLTMTMPISCHARPLAESSSAHSSIGFTERFFAASACLGIQYSRASRMSHS